MAESDQKTQTLREVRELPPSLAPRSPMAAKLHLAEAEAEGEAELASSVLSTPMKATRPSTMKSPMNSMEPMPHRFIDDGFADIGSEEASDE